MIKPNTLYKHNKSGNHYVVLSEVINCTNAQDGQTLVLYQSFGMDNLKFVREKSEFLKKFTPLE